MDKKMADHVVDDEIEDDELANRPNFSYLVSNE